MTSRTTLAYIPSSHLDLFWLGNYNTTLERGAHVIKVYLDRCLETKDETFLLETTVFADYFLHRYPEYREPLLQLVREKRVEVGAAFVDRWEHLTPAESIIRNIQAGVAWCREMLGIEPTLVTHPDLPSLLPQTSQIYAQAGIRYYVTSRKIFEHGAVWRHISPDGTTLLYLNWPRHYIYFPIETSDLSTAADRWRSAGLDIDASREAFPLGIIPVNGSAGDLRDPESFKDRYGDYLWNLVADNRQKYPEYEFSYTVPSAVLEPYAHVEDLPERQGEIPSVWGVACDEEVAFFRRNRELEDTLLTAETIAAVATHSNLNWLPTSAETWQGALHESAFFARKDPIPPDRVFNALWRMQMFSEDHNGGGYEGTLSSFQKRVIQERTLDYANQIIKTGLASIAREITTHESGILVFNPLGRAWSGPVPIEFPEAVWKAGLRLTGPCGHPLPAQVDYVADSKFAVQVWLDAVPSVGYSFISLAPEKNPMDTKATTISRTEDELQLENERFRLAIDLASGAVSQLYDRKAHVDWGHSSLFNIEALREIGSDVTLRMNPDAQAVTSSALDVEVTANGPLFTRVRLTKTILDAAVTQTITLWSKSERIDVETRIRWWGSHNWQLRLALPVPDDVARIAYGTPFYGAAWTDVVPDAAPRNPDEILPEDYHAYREVQQWLHLGRAGAGLLLVTSHPGFYYGDDGLAAVLMRTSPSCGDVRLFWENAGEQVYRFSILPTGPSWQAAKPFDLAASVLRTPKQVFAEELGHGMLPSSQSYLTMQAGTAVLSSIARDNDHGMVRIRLFEGTGAPDVVRLEGPLIDDTRIDLVDLIDRKIDGDINGSEASFDLSPWRIQTLRIIKDEP